VVLPVCYIALSQEREKQPKVRLTFLSYRHNHLQSSLLLITFQITYVLVSKIEFTATLRQKETKFFYSTITSLSTRDNNYKIQIIRLTKEGPLSYSNK